MPEFQPKPKPMPVPVPRPDTLPQPQPVKRPVAQPGIEPQGTEENKENAYNVKPDSIDEAAATKKSANDEYDKALQDVLSILNKR